MSADTKIASPRAHGTVRVTLPAKIAYNREALKRTIGTLLENLGCTRCFSGASCVFEAERNFVVDSGGIFSHVAADTNPPPTPWRADLTVALAPGNQFNIDQVFTAVDSVINTIGGCLPCHSGFNILYLNEVEFLGIGPEGQVQQYGG